MQRNQRTGRRASGLSSRLAALLWPGNERAPRRASPSIYEEDEVRDRIYGWHSGTVEPPEPVDSSRLAGITTGSAALDETNATLGSDPTDGPLTPGAATPGKGDDSDA